jgi:hypothetical protein
MVVAPTASRDIAVTAAAIATTTATTVTTTFAAAGIATVTAGITTATTTITGQANDGLERGHEESRGQPAQQALPS